MQLIISGGLNAKQYGSWFASGRVREIHVLPPSCERQESQLRDGIALARMSNLPIWVHPDAEKYMN